MGQVQVEKVQSHDRSGGQGVIAGSRRDGCLLAGDAPLNKGRMAQGKALGFALVLIGDKCQLLKCNRARSPMPRRSVSGRRRSKIRDLRRATARKSHSSAVRQPAVHDQRMLSIPIGSLSLLQDRSAVTARIPRSCASARQARSPSDSPSAWVAGTSAAAMAAC
jgi:hypothetical protein